MPREPRIAPSLAAPLLKRVAARLRLNLAAEALVASVAEVASAAAALLAVAAILLRLPSLPGASAIGSATVPAAVLPLLAVAVAVRVAMRLRRVSISPLEAAIEVDRRLSLRERLSSATAAAEPADGSADPLVAAWVRGDAERRTAGLRAAAVTPLRRPRGVGVALLGLAAVALLLADLSRSRTRETVAAPRAESVAVAARVAELAATIESAEASRRELGEDPAAASRELERSLAALDAEAARLAQAAASGDPASQRQAIEAAAELGSAAERLETLAESRRQAIEEFAASFEGLAPRGLPPLASGLAQQLLEGEFDSAVEALESLAREQARGDREAAEAIESLANAIDRLRQAGQETLERGEEVDDTPPRDAADAAEALEPGLAAEGLDGEPGRERDPQAVDREAAGDAQEAPSGGASEPGERGEPSAGDPREPDAPPPPRGEAEPPAAPPEDASREPSWLDRFAEALRSLAAESGEPPPQPEPEGSPPDESAAGEETRETREESLPAEGEELSQQQQPTAGEAVSTRPEAAPGREPDSTTASQADRIGDAAEANAREGRSPDGERSTASDGRSDGDASDALESAAAPGEADSGQPGPPRAGGGADRGGGDPGSELLRRIAEERRQVERWQRDAQGLERLSRRLAESARGSAAPAAAAERVAASGEDRPRPREVVEVGEDEGPPGQRLATWLDLPSLPEGVSAEAVVGDPAAVAAARRAAERAIEGGSVHPRHHAAVRRYFSRLESASPPSP